ncbi:putative 6-phosphogluconolactonase-like [Apostichopus japonicus]|uniref:6-phosphogluconolactonase n=2 Tax=Stichopus japonicus TaxID=307972 RepID=A0A2G8LNH0_STIJA|nr:putative 6-phosphogluconolactonase-like [Apostichopus japonicus]
MAAKRVHINATEAVPKVVAKFVADKSKEAVQARGEFYIGVSGGSVAKFLGKELPAMEGIQWAKWHVYFCDERLVGFDNDDSTYKLYKENWLAGKTSLPEEQMYAIKPELSVEEAAKDYASKVDKVPKNEKGLPVFDLLVLGMGPDGHTCSLFPGHPLLNETSLTIAPISDSPKPPPCRVTMTFPVIDSSRCALFASTGAGKADNVKRVLEVEEAVPLPAARVNPQGEVHWFLDEAAAGKLTKQYSNM